MHTLSAGIRLRAVNTPLFDLKHQSPEVPHQSREFLHPLPIHRKCQAQGAEQQRKPELGDNREPVCPWNKVFSWRIGSPPGPLPARRERWSGQHLWNSHLLDAPPRNWSQQGLFVQGTQCVFNLWNPVLSTTDAKLFQWNHGIPRGRGAHRGDGAPREHWAHRSHGAHRGLRNSQGPLD